MPDCVYKNAIDWKIHKDDIEDEEIVAFLMPLNDLTRLMVDSTNKSQVRVSDRQPGEISVLENEIESLGQKEPIYVQHETSTGDNIIKTGNGRFRALRSLATKEVTVPNRITNTGTEHYQAIYGCLLKPKR